MGQTFAGGGQLVRQSQIVQNPNDGSVSLELAARHYYGADDKLMAVQRYSWRSPSLSDGTWEEYWYDALGRRVLTRARRDPSSIYDAFTSGPLCMGGIHCRSFTERVWWDGDQALIEERTPEGTSDVSNSGLVGNIHGLTLDEPLAVMSDQMRIVNYNWRGLGQSSVFPNGQAGDASLGNSATEIDWPALTQAQTYFTPGPGSGGGSNPKRWMGTFVANGQGTTGMLYRRNRYFSPTSGQFTQSDPIGIAGGMNAFGFAAGDPVNYSDPFGLIPYLNCRPVKADSDYGHCAIRVYDAERKIDITFELIPSEPSLTAPFGRKRIVWSLPTDPRVKAYDFRGWVQIRKPKGMSDADFDRAILNSALKVQSDIEGDRYSFSGKTNSNRFIFDLIKGAGGTVPGSPARRFPKGAPGLCGGTGIGAGSTGSDCKPK